jgi:AcrR family transcriptional regulator
MDERRRYHHGNLRDALIKAALEILDTDGLSALSLRAAAARAGVSHAAPKHHFGNMRGLVGAVVAHGYRQLDAMMAENRARSSDDLVEQVRASHRAYARFAIENPGLFRLMFSRAHFDFSDESLRDTVVGANQHLESLSRAIAAAIGADVERDWRAIATAIWTSAHGYAHLLIDGRLVNRETGEPEPIPDIGRFLFEGFNGPRRGQG